MTNLPEGFAKRSLGALPPGEREAFISALLTQASARGIRLRNGVNPASVKAAGIALEAPVPWAENAYYLGENTGEGRHLLHAAGAYYLQEPSAMAPVSALSPAPGRQVLDLCAAPGGKSTQLAALLRGEGVLVCNEIIPSRAKVLSENIERMGVTNAIVTNEPPARLADRWAGRFDCILVDAPCSGEGMFRREPESRAQWTHVAPQGCAVRQTHLLQSAASMLREGGALVYSTCTFNETENERVVEAFLRGHPDFAPEAFELPGVGRSADGCLRLWPHRIRGEGHFVAKLRKKGRRSASSGEKAGAAVTLGEVDPVFADTKIPGILQRNGETVWVIPEDTPPLDGFRVLRNGLCLGTQKRGNFIPNHAAAMALAPGSLAMAWAVDGDAAAAYLRGETLPADGCANGWGIVSHRGLSLGFGKCVDGILKNHLPKGLRRAL